jgi:hypothetical protein
VAAVFAPLAFAGATSDISTSWVRKWIETMVALVVSKLILVIIFVIGLGVLTDGLGEVTRNVKGAGASATQSITQTIIGALILLMAGFAPWLAIKLVHFGGEHFGQIHGHARSALAGAQTVAAAPRKAQSLAGGFAEVRTGGSAAPAGAGSGPGGLAGGAPGGPLSSQPLPGQTPGAGSLGVTTSAGGDSGSVGVAAAGSVGVAGAVAGAAGAAKAALDECPGQIADVSSGVTPTTPPSTPPSSTAVPKEKPPTGG